MIEAPEVERTGLCGARYQHLVVTPGGCEQDTVLLLGGCRVAVSPESTRKFALYSTPVLQVAGKLDAGD